MPPSAEVRELDAVGDEVDRRMLHEGNAVMLARVTWNGARQLIFYVRDPKIANERLQDLLSRRPARREWEFRMEHDAEWEFAEPYLRLLRDSKS
ncbi:MAG: DUF695 domain-containing protein [Deltaproteobacteria bacterium]|nr:DUF695 domain-containing protein [Deltaproteobacteria bacterium]